MRRILLVLFVSSLVAAPRSASAAGVKLSDRVVGKIQRPEVEYILTKQNLTPQYEFELKESFVPRMIQSVNSRAF